MTDLEIKDIFSRFQNLNLLTLINDLEIGVVARFVWYRYIARGKINMCPLSHGFRMRYKAANFDYQGIRDIGISDCVTSEFVYDWDKGMICRSRLLGLLRSIYQERLVDADSMQEVLQLPSTKGLVSCV